MDPVRVLYSPGVASLNMQSCLWRAYLLQNVTCVNLACPQTDMSHQTYSSADANLRWGHTATSESMPAHLILSIDPILPILIYQLNKMLSGFEAVFKVIRLGQAWGMSSSHIIEMEASVVGKSQIELYCKKEQKQGNDIINLKGSLWQLDALLKH